MIKVVNLSPVRQKSYFFLFVILLFLLLFFFSQKHIESITEISSSIDWICYACFEDVLPITKKGNLDEKTPIGLSVIAAEFPFLQMDTIENQTIESDSPFVAEVEPLQETSSDSVLSPEPEIYTNEYQGVYVSNSSNYSLTYQMLDPSDFTISNQKVLIFHTHTCESYTPTEQYSYEESGNFRTTDLNYSVAKVGDVLKDELDSYGFDVTHDTTYHDYPSYNGSYGRSLATVQSLLASHPDTDIIIDLHRDAISDSSYAPSISINGETVSQLMFVIGTDGSGLDHPNWQNNLKFAVKVQEKANELYPGLFKPIILRNSRYNQHLGKAACIIEVGATGNTLEQSMASMKYLATVLNEIIAK